LTQNELGYILGVSSQTHPITLFEAFDNGFERESELCIALQRRYVTFSKFFKVYCSFDVALTGKFGYIHM
jgi:hypothetical protein